MRRERHASERFPPLCPAAEVLGRRAEIVEVCCELCPYPSAVHMHCQFPKLGS